MFKNFDFIIVGAGLFGSVMASKLAARGYNICILDKRNHIGGNCYDELDSHTNIRIHLYGPHIFHCNNKDVLSYIGNFCKFNSYFHRVLAVYKDKMFELPFNLNTINQFYNKNLKPYEVQDFLNKEIEKYKIENPCNMEEKAISLIGRPMYEAFMKEYTMKQWGKKPSELPGSIIHRIPVRYNYNACYFSKSFHGIPVGGYTKIFEKMLSSDKIKIMLKTNYFEVKNQIPHDRKIIFTGPIDAYFSYKFGKLEYRKLHFEKEFYSVKDWQGSSVINYPEAKYGYTRICEPRYFHPEDDQSYSQDKTVIFKEYSELDNGEDPYYPINNSENSRILKEYNKMAEIHKNLYFGGRLGEYKYYDMEDTITSALKLSEIVAI